MDFSKKYGDWRGDRKLPASFILFFVLTFFLLGEQLLALPLYLIGPGTGGDGPDKVSILDMSLSDALHRPLFYLLFGFISWIMFRSLSWPIVWIGASTIWLVFKWFLPDPGDTQNIIGTFIGVGFFIVIPYFIYRTVDRKWGTKGRRNAILILTAINILFLGFFAYQIYGLNNSYHGYTSRGSLIRNESSYGQNLPVSPETYSNLSIITPYLNETDISSINEAFSNTENSPWGFKHLGIDFMTSSDLVYFQAVTDGTITNLKTSKENEQQGWHTGLCIDHSPYLICYNFETFSSDQADGDRQKASIWVENGRHVKQGDIIGQLVYGGNGAHVDLGVIHLGKERSCPEPYFTEDAKTSILRLIHKDHPTWKLCYE
ncbi:MAG: hypothetical protein HY361_01115 [Candidatus Aenigmarchaeota archaeon]|nr:hypothetical protein [Candidatus Aenigmarchaeota archaeon]